jgi:hypothetical protein
MSSSSWGRETYSTHVRYNADERWGLDYWSHRVFVIPAVGTDASGSDVRGYWYDIRGDGTLIPTGEKTGLDDFG